MFYEHVWYTQFVSDSPKDSSWWEGADGKWYPPVAKKSDSDSAGSDSSTLPSAMKKLGKRRLLLLGLVAVALFGAGFIVFQMRKPEYKWTRLDLELVDTRPDSGSWDVLPDCQDKGPYGLANTGCTCDLSPGYRDLNSSTPIVVFGAKGEEVGRGELSIGRFYHVGEGRWVTNMSEYDSKKARKCVWDVNVQIPDNEKYYVLQIGDRGEVKYDFDEITTFSRTLTIEDD